MKTLCARSLETRNAKMEYMDREKWKDFVNGTNNGAGLFNICSWWSVFFILGKQILWKSEGGNLCPWEDVYVC